MALILSKMTVSDSPDSLGGSVDGLHRALVLRELWLVRPSFLSPSIPATLDKSVFLSAIAPWSGTRINKARSKLLLMAASTGKADSQICGSVEIVPEQALEVRRKIRLL